VDPAHILIADDDPVLLDLMVRRITRLGHRADSANDGRAALVMLKRARYDLVVTDIYMPGVSGLDVLIEARARDPNLQVIVITAAATLENAVQALNNGAFSYLSKPFDHLSVFDTAVSRALEYRRLSLDNLRMAEIQKRRGDLLEAEVGERIQQLRKSQRELLDLLALLPEGVLVLNAEGKIVLTNPAAERWLARDFATKERPIQAYLQEVARGQVGPIETVTVSGHTLSVTALDLPMQEDKRRFVILMRGETASERPSPDILDAIRRMRAPLIGLYTTYSTGPAAGLVRELAILVSRIEQHMIGPSPEGPPASSKPQATPEAARHAGSESVPRAKIMPSLSAHEAYASLSARGLDRSTSESPPDTRPGPTQASAGSVRQAADTLPSAPDRKRVTALGSDLLRRGLPLQDDEDPPAQFPDSTGVPRGRKRTDSRP